jgi:hypothetical protein
VLDVALDVLLRELAADQTLDAVDGLEGVRRGLVLGGVSDKSLFLGESDVGGGDAVSWRWTVSCESRRCSKFGFQTHLDR